MHNKLIPITYSADSISIGMSDIFDIVAIDQIRRYFPPNFKIVPVYIPESDLIHAIDHYYGYEMSIEGILKEIEESGADDIGDEAQLRGDYKSPMVRLVDAILTDAVHYGASDLHFELKIYFRN